MKYTYKINDGVSGMSFHGSVNAADYEHNDGYYDFYDGFGNNREKVESISDRLIARIARVEKS
ncbi:hypothetical protein [Curtobacterium sp. VKM Ac-1395]|uniref:hypothetical protein n=1 Tax=Curtobacterium sp. VKM Ac-1395 TaxID=2783815 RepID=UPI00188D777B|nr:hypothetical protein [Curtobacterium sp. VKM Ac-1395]MBF4590761.1 hypothetical protein [Curtobacterium sp. VKM Ac-1395]